MQKNAAALAADRSPSSIFFTLMIRIIINNKIISPERIESVTFEENKENFKAIVTDKTMTKSATLKGEIQFINVKNGAILINTPYSTTSTFRHKYADVNGNQSACSKETLHLLNSELIDFPNDESLLKDAATKLNQLLKHHFLEK